jgi:lipopolysaccharide biosynthesis glycosyltransferase
MSITGQRWNRPDGTGPVSDSKMIALAKKQKPWATMAYQYGSGFIHLSKYHDYQQRDPFLNLPQNKREDIVAYLQRYYRGTVTIESTFEEVALYIPEVFDKISDNTNSYVHALESSMRQLSE